MKQLYSALLIAIAATVATHAQEWTVSTGGPGQEVGRFIEQTSDGGFLVGGTQSATSGGARRFWVSRYDSTGALRWDSSYGRSGTTHTLFAFSRTTDDGFMVGGFTGQQFSGAESALMYRGDSSGNTLWNIDIDYASSDHWHFLLERPEGGYYMGGHTDSKADPNGDMWLVKLDSARNVIWEKEYDRGFSEHAHSGILTSDGSVVMLGHTEANGLEKWWAVKVDSSGEVLWQKVLSSASNYHDAPYRVFETREGNYAFIGGTFHMSQNLGRIWLVVTDTDGQIKINKQYGDPSGSTFGWSGRQTSDGGFIIAGETDFRTHGDYDMIVVKADSAGNEEWSETIGGTGADYGFDVIETPSGYVAAGYTASPSLMTGGGGDMMLVKIAKPSTSATPAASPVATIAATIAPNPAGSDVRLRLALPRALAIHVQVYDLHGRLLLTVPERALAAGTHSLGIDTRTLPQGVHFVRIECDGTALVTLPLSVLR